MITLRWGRPLPVRSRSVSTKPSPNAMTQILIQAGLRSTRWRQFTVGRGAQGEMRAASIDRCWSSPAKGMAGAAWSSCMTAACVLSTTISSATPLANASIDAMTRPHAMGWMNAFICTSGNAGAGARACRVLALPQCVAAWAKRMLFSRWMCCIKSSRSSSNPRYSARQVLQAFAGGVMSLVSSARRCKASPC